MNLKDKVPVMHCAGVEGPSLYINNFRVCGPKPWGGGRIIYEWKSAEKGDILQALGDDFVQVVNSHEALVERLQENTSLLATLETFPIPMEWIQKIQAQIDDNRAALRKAGA